MTSSTHIDIKASRRFKRLALNTVITLYLLIIAGGVVRSTGSGMGCPDWPKCFGRWVPPTEVSQLPHDYKELYGAKLKGEIEFNPIKTWTEYVNRLLGAFTGIMILLTFFASLPYFKTDRKVVWASFSALLLVGFQGWLGAKVVSFELHPVIVTLHMLLAIVIVFIALYVYIVVSRGGEAGRNEYAGIGRNLGLIVLFITLLQVLLGTQVRENIDEVVKALGYESRDTWIDHLGLRFYIHRSFSIVVLGLNLYWFSLIYKVKNVSPVVLNCVKGCIAVLILEILTGVVMAYFGVPPYAQPMHLTLGILMLGLQFVIQLLLNPGKSTRLRGVELIEN